MISTNLCFMFIVMVAVRRFYIPCPQNNIICLYSRPMITLNLQQVNNVLMASIQRFFKVNNASNNPINRIKFFIQLATYFYHWFSNLKISNEIYVKARFTWIKSDLKSQNVLTQFRQKSIEKVLCVCRFYVCVDSYPNYLGNTKKWGICKRPWRKFPCSCESYIILLTLGNISGSFFDRSLRSRIRCWKLCISTTLAVEPQ